MSDEGRMALERWMAEMKADPGVPIYRSAPEYDPGLGQPEPSLVPFLLPARSSAMVIVCAGGGFNIKAPHEGRPIAKWLNTLGIAAAVLDYRLGPYRFETIAGDASRSIRFARSKADEWRIDAGRIGIIGFSAGGTLVATTATRFDAGTASDDPVDGYSSRPDAQILCYPFIPVSTDPLDQRNEAENRAFMADRDGNDLAAEYVADLNTTPQTPPAFLWGTRDDFLAATWRPYLDALAANNVEYAFHLFRSGPHGMGLAEDHPSARHWPDLCAAWLGEIGFRR